jgi:hypothetical protein
LEKIEKGATHLDVATDHVIESFLPLLVFLAVVPLHVLSPATEAWRYERAP